MGLTKTEVNLRRLLAALPQQTNQAKLAQYIVTLKEQLAILTGESGQGNLPCISEEKAKEYAELIDAAASKLSTEGFDVWDTLAANDALFSNDGKSRENVEVPKLEIPAATGLRRRILLSDETNHSVDGNDSASGEHGRHNVTTDNVGGSSIKADAATLEHIEKHRHLQENLTDEMVEMARRMKEASVAMNRAVLESNKVLDSTENAIERSLASTNQANKRAQAIYSQSFKTSCLTWLVMFLMLGMFMFVVFLIRVT